MRIAFTTLGCPNWNLDTICQRGQQYGFDGVDFRGYLDELDITKLPQFTTQAEQTRTKLNDAGLVVSAISSSVKICQAESRQENIDEARRTIAAAQKLDCKHVRVFGGGHLDGSSHTELARVGLECMQNILELDGASALLWLFETHDNWIKSADCKLLLDNIHHPAFGALWDMGHTARVGGESPEESYAAVGQRIGYTHVKDAVFDPTHEQAMADGWRYVPPGKGQLPLAEAIRLLRRNGYGGWVVFEHEKRWHPQLDEPEIALPAFVKWIRPLLA